MTGITGLGGNSASKPRFAKVPDWLEWAGASANATKVWVHLALFGTWNEATGTYDNCRPSKPTLTDGGQLRERTGYPGTGLSVSTVERALNELKKLGAAVPTIRRDPESGGQLPTAWRLHFRRPAAVPTAPKVAEVCWDTAAPPTPPMTWGDPTHDVAPHPTHDVAPTPPMTWNQEPLTKNQDTNKKARASASLRPAVVDAQHPLVGIDSPASPSSKERPPTSRDRAFGLARAWIKRRGDAGTPVTGAQPEHKLRRLIEPVLASYDENEVKAALDDVGEGIPSSAQLDRALAARRTGRTAGRPVTTRHLDKRAAGPADDPFAAFTDTAEHAKAGT
jgi:hypothetical protein